MGMYCCCGVNKSKEGWTCECDWKGWFLCWEQKHPEVHSIPVAVPVKAIPEKNGVYKVRVFEDGDFNEKKSEFSVISKNWGEPTNESISHWKITYSDGWCGYRGVYAWKEKDEQCGNSVRLDKPHET